MMTLEEFKSKIVKRNTKKNFKISGSYGVRNVYKALQRQKWPDIGKPVSEYEFYTIIRSINNLLANEIMLGNTVTFPSRMGKLELRKYKPQVRIVKGKLKIGYAIDWDSTINLWYKDEEARKSKILLRKESPEIFRVAYCKYNATYENKTFYAFALNRHIKKTLKTYIQQGKIDTLW